MLCDPEERPRKPFSKVGYTAGPSRGKAYASSGDGGTALAAHGFNQIRDPNLR